MNGIYHFELMLGNLCQDQFGNLCKVVGLSDTSIKGIDRENICFYVVDRSKFPLQEESYPIVPIPLTKEWLLKFGFIWKNYGLRKELMCIREEGSLFTMYLSNESNPFPVGLKYVHQLQNLHFALTGEELILSND